MKHLRKFNESSVEDVKADIRDIFSELEDNGFLVIHDESHDFGLITTGYITILLDGTTIDNAKSFTLDSEIVQTILRFIDYLKISGLYFNGITIMSPTRWTLPASDITEEGIFIKGKLELKTDSDSKIRQIKLTYSKYQGSM
jgi:hypothetical protein